MHELLGAIELSGAMDPTMMEGGALDLLSAHCKVLAIAFEFKARPLAGCNSTVRIRLYRQRDVRACRS
jgi:hypothetical protein